MTCLACRARSLASSNGLTVGAAPDCDEVAAENDAKVKVDRGAPGASALREYQRRRSDRIEKTSTEHPHLGGLLLGVRSAPQHEVAFLSGAEGEREVAESLEARARDSPAVFLHDRRMPRGHGRPDC